MTEAPREYFTLGRNSAQIIRDGSFPTRKEHLENTLFNHHVVENNMRMQGLLRKLHAAYIHQKIPDFIGYFFLGQISNCPEQRMADSILREMQLLKNKQCHYIPIMRTINARESCLKSLQRCLESVFQDSSQPLMATFRSQIGHYRQLTALTIEQIQQWKEYLLGISPSVFGEEHIAFFYQGSDYLLKILNDTDFMGQSFLSSKVTFSYKQDPFMLRPYTENQSKDDLFLQLFKYEPEQRERFVKSLQFLADERADYLKRKITVKQERIREIEKAYQSKTVTSRIIITKPQLSLAKKQKQILLETPIDFVEESRELSQSKMSKKMGTVNENKLKDFLIRGEKIRKIKEMRIGEPQALINPKRFSNLEGASVKQEQPVKRSLSLGFLKRTSPFKKQKSERQDNNTDFESMLRDKQLQILQSDSKKRRTFSSVRLNDRLSERKTFINQQGAQQLRKILEQLDYASPQQQQGFLKKRIASSKPQKTLLQHNEEAMLNLRQQVLKEIEDHESQKERLEQQKRDEREQMQRIIKEKLDKQTLLDIQKQKSKWTEGKDVLAHEMGKKELFGYADPVSKKSMKLTELEMQLKKEMQLKWLRQVHEQLKHREAMNILQREQKQQEVKREQELQVAKRKLQQQKRFEQIQKEQRLKAMSLQLQKQERKKKEIEQEMEEVVSRQKNKLESFSQQQKLELEEQMKETVKVNLLNQLKRQKSQFASEIKAKEAKRLEEEAHRAEVRRKIQSEFEIQQQLERQRERQDKKLKLKMVAKKMEHIQKELINDKTTKENNQQKEQQLAALKKSITSFPDPRSSEIRPIREQSKKKLRQQFQLQLFSFNRETDTMQNNFFVKDFKSKIDGDDNLNARMTELEQEIKRDEEDAKREMEMDDKRIEKGNEKEEKQTIQQEMQVIGSLPKNSSLAFQRDPSSVSDKFVRFSSEKSQLSKQEEVKQPTITQSDLKKIGIDMSPVEYMMYIKKKATLDAKKIIPIKQQQQKKKVKKILDEFEIMQDLNERIKKAEETKSVVIENISQNENESKSKEELKESQEKSVKEGSEINEDKKARQAKIQKSQQKKERDSQQLSQLMKLTVHSKMSPKRKKRFVTSDNDSDQSDSPKTKKKKQKKVKQDEQDLKLQSKKKLEVSHQQTNKKIVEPKQSSKRNAIFTEVEQQNLENFLIDHFKKMPKLLRRLNLFKKDELMKMILQTKNIMIVSARKGEELQGITFLTQNQNKQSIRSITMLQLGAYDPDNTIEVLLQTRDLLFSVDPCAELTLSMYYEKEDAEQNQFIKEFQRRFDPYGAIFQKKINNEQTQRKHVMRRMIGQQSKKALVENKSIGQIKVRLDLLVHSQNQSLGLQLGLSDLGSSLGGWTALSLFLSKYGDEEQLAEVLSSDVREENKNMKYISKMAAKLKTGTIRDIDYTQFANPFQTNLRLIQQKSDILKCDPKLQQNDIPIKCMHLDLTIQPTLPFVSTSATIEHQGDSLKVNYLRYKCGKGSKVVKLKSSLYSSELIVIPCKPSNYKLMVMQASELDTLKNNNCLDLYFKLFLANVDKHTLATDEHIWIPQFRSEQTKTIGLAKTFGFENELRSKANIHYTQYIPNCLSYSPNHKDIFVTPPFLVAILNSEIQRLTESSPIYIERIDIQQLTGLEVLPKPAPESDF